MSSRAPDVAQIRYRNALILFDEFVRATVTHPDDAALRGLERRFAEKLQVQPSYWSQIKSRARQIGERLARQFEQRCHKPHGWMDQPQGAVSAHAGGPAVRDAMPAAALEAALSDDERFVVSLVLSYYRRDPARARARLLDMLGEVLNAPLLATAVPRDVDMPAAPGATAPTRGGAPRSRALALPPAAAPATDDDTALWNRVSRAATPLKRGR